MIYADTSSILKLLLPEPLSQQTWEFSTSESQILVSQITRLEANVQLRGRYLGGSLRINQINKVTEQLETLLKSEVFLFPQLSATLFETAFRQHQETAIHCRSLDRLHLAAMEELGIKRLMTHDARQAEAARAMGMAVVMPGME